MKVLYNNITADLPEWVMNFCHLFLIKEENASAIFIGTPAQLRASLDKLFILANKNGIKIESTVWQKYPNICPYCLAKPCSCGPTKTAPHKYLNIPPPEKELNIENLQKMLKEIYPRGTSLIIELRNIISETTEFSLALFSSNNRRDIEDEFADLFARFIRIANTLNINIQGFI
jgi:hypothetical protein